MLPERLLIGLRGAGGLGSSSSSSSSSSGHPHQHLHRGGLVYSHWLVHAVESLRRRDGDGDGDGGEQRVVLTGHSLGGSLAKIVAAAANVPVVGISSPGVFLSARGFGVDGDRLKYLESNLVCENDVFPWLDRMQGAVFHLACAKPNPLLCHQPGQTICELVRACGGFEPRLFDGCMFVA